MPSTEHHTGSNATTVPSTMPFGVLSRRAAMLGTLTIAGFGASLHRPAVVPAATVGATTSTSADVDLIAHAHRIVALARRCDAVIERQANIMERVEDLCPAPKPLPKPALGNSITETETPIGRIFHITQATERDPARVEWERATEVAKQAHRQKERATAERLGLPEIDRRSSRMIARRDRWASDLVGMRPSTAAGLAAKASAMTALMGEDWVSQGDAFERHGELLGAVLADAVRLGTGGQA